ncbi:choice-of-anchor A family protein [Siccirubricoccus sp. KC 17139]|uniref:Choice-of-anchor A family protein n=1 Tax=Siccirubricoccus soli TaxID=2899147 RepID=A0ABT1DB49_9PROT|nr:choice-of-anchor A family protein [Siccirubricoccus soli]MCO6419167.1 choice-of-anchor A family protein [Siccirubricoccus soli]MCP2685302.1 choice-of-anchor A family protein [Siccirubricoccus soli]
MFMRRLSLLAALLLVALPLHAAPVTPDPLTAKDILTQFNAVITGSFSSNHDVEGRLVAGSITGHASSTLYLKPNPAAAPSAFAAVNVVNVAAGVNKNVNNGGSVNVQGSNAGRFNLNGGGRVGSTPAFTIGDFATPLNALQTQLAGLAANSAVSSRVPGNNDPNLLQLTVTPNAQGLAVFTLTTTQLAGLRNIEFGGAGTADTIVINVTGGSYSQPGGQNFNADAWLNSHVIWNFVDATALSLKSWHGTILAGQAAVTNNSPLEGFLYAASFDGRGELHDVPFAGTLPTPPTLAPNPDPRPVPEPGGAVLLGLGLAGLAVALRLRLRSAAQPAPG